MKIISKKPVYQVVIEYEGEDWSTGYVEVFNWLREHCSYHSFEEEEVVGYKPLITRLTVNIVEKDDEV